MLDLNRLLEPNAIVPVDMQTTRLLIDAIRSLRDELQARAEDARNDEAAALLWIAAVANKCGTDGVLHLTDADMRAAANLVLERADDPDGGVLIRVSQEQAPQIVEHTPVLAKVDSSIVLTSH